MQKKRAFTLLEIMIVIFLIGLIGSIIGYNMKGSMDEGRAFKTKQAIIRVTDLLELAMAKGATPTQITEHTEEYIAGAGVLKNPKKFLKDGWGNKLDIVVDDYGDISVSSDKYEDYLSKKPDYNRDDD